MQLLAFDLLGVIFPKKGGGSKKKIKELFDSLPEKHISFEDFYSRYLKYNIGEIKNSDFWEGFTFNTKEIEKKYLDSYDIHDNLDILFLKLNENYKIIAISNHPSEWVDYLSKKHELNKYFQKIYSSGSMKLRKPQKEMFLKIFKEQNIDPFECTIIDDQKKNLISASELGFKTIHVKINEDLIDFKPDLEIKSLNELITHFHH